MTRHEQLRENYEDALFALLMEEMAEQEGKRLLEENERLKQDPAAAVPKEVNQRCLKAIKQAFAKERRREVAKVSYRVLNKVAMVAMIGVLLFASAFAAIPEVRTRTLNLMIQVSEVSTSLTLTGENSGNHSVTVTSDSTENLRGYRLPELPEGFTVDYEGGSSRSAWIQYVNEDGATVYFRVGKAGNSGINVDTENAQVENIQIHGYDGLLIEKQYVFEDGTMNSVTAIWGDTDQGNFVSVSCAEIDKDTVLRYAESMEFINN